MTMQEIIKTCPEVGRVLERAAVSTGYIAHEYSRYKHELVQLVGWKSGHEDLRNSDVYCQDITALDDVLCDRDLPEYGWCQWAN